MEESPKFRGFLETSSTQGYHEFDKGIRLKCTHLLLEWTGRALPLTVFLLAQEPQAFPCKLVSPTQASHNQYSTRKHWQTTHSNKQQQDGKIHQRWSLWTVSQLSLSQIAGQIVGYSICIPWTQITWNSLKFSITLSFIYLVVFQSTWIKNLVV